MSKMREDWQTAKDSVKKTLDVEEELGKLGLGPLLDEVATAEKEYEKVTDQTAKNPDDKKDTKAREKLAKAIGNASKPLATYLNGLKGIERARPDQADAAGTLVASLVRIQTKMDSIRKRCGIKKPQR